MKQNSAKKELIYKLGSIFVWRSPGVGYYEINGKFNVSVGYDEKSVSLSIKPETIVAVSSRRPLIGYRNSAVEGPPTVTVEEYQAKKTEAYEWDEVNEEDRFKSLDHEFAWKKFIQDLVSVYGEEETRNDVEFEIQELDGNETVPPYCTPDRLIDYKPGQTNLTTWTYIPNRLELCIEIGKMYDFEYTPTVSDHALRERCWNIPKHGIAKLDFIKIGLGGNFASYSMLDAVGSAFGTIEECRAKHDRNIDLIHEFWRHESVKRVQVTPDAITLGEIQTRLQSLKSEISAIRSKANTEGSLFSSKQMVSELLRDIAKTAKLIEATQ